MLLYKQLRAMVPSVSHSRASLLSTSSSFIRIARPLSSSSIERDTGPVGVARAIAAATNPEISTSQATSTLFTRELALTDRVAFVTGANRGLGLEMAMAMMTESDGKQRRFHYVQGDVRDQANMWEIAREIGNKEGRFDVGVAAAGIEKGGIPATQFPEGSFRDVIDVNLNGVLYSAQAAGQQMERFANGGSIILIASICGHIAVKPIYQVAYHSAKSGVLQMARTMACELGSQNIRVNSISPGFINTTMIEEVYRVPELLQYVESLNPLGRIGRPDELRGVATWLASDASSFCTGSDINVSGGSTAW
ncbi:sorbose reductase sou1 [Epithele typhae]|uniref:sorbose reductase sou1 n=1 Tax=Epithele typhae TaxID=378194 RepID=UPI0020087108|nr:sorbose reductase sou1 [Epithele typhae]KAH9930419.1 sorbose reductase sou1 [Epithele typhae]